MKKEESKRETLKKVEPKMYLLGKRVEVKKVKPLWTYKEGYLVGGLNE